MSEKGKLFLCAFQLKHNYHSLLDKDFVKKVIDCDEESAKI